jgi:hypothetical protein
VESDGGGFNTGGRKPPPNIEHLQEKYQRLVERYVSSNSLTCINLKYRFGALENTSVSS